MKKRFQNLIKNRAFLATLLCGIVIASVACVTAGLSGNISRQKETDENHTSESLDLNTPKEEDSLAQAELTEAPESAEATETDATVTESEEEASGDIPQDIALSDNPSDTPEEASQGELPNENHALSVDSSMVTAAFPVTFSEESYLSWPVIGEVLMTFSPDKTVYFATLEQYKTNDAILIQSDAGASVRVPQNCVVTSIGRREDIGEYVTLDLGEGYAITLGQLTNISVNVSETVPNGTVIAQVAEPTRYYTVEGYHLYVRMTKNLEAIDPLDYLQ